VRWAVVVIIVLIASNLTMLLAVSSGRLVASDVPWPNEYPLISPLRSMRAQEHFFTSLQPLREQLTTVLSASPLRSGLYIEYLNTGASISIGAEERFWPASLVKVPVAMAAWRAVEDGLWTADQKLVLQDADRHSVAPVLGGRASGDTVALADALDALLVASDNVAYNLLVRSLPPGALNDLLRALGLEDLFDASGRLAPREYSRIFRALYTSSYLTPDHSQDILARLDRTDFNYFLRGAVPTSVQFPHKWGYHPEERTHSDAGIVYLHNRPYLVVVMAQAADSVNERDAVMKLMTDVSARAYVFFSGEGAR
jgi:beta-lactamase class A